MDDNMEKINLFEKFSKFTEHWEPRVIAEMNNYQFKLVRIKGDFIWHNHPDTDETFIVIQGNMKIQFKNSIVEIGEGEMIIVPKGVNHKPIAEDECLVMLVEPRGVVNTGEKVSDYTAPNDVWI
tara:strand:- start:209 stop:580 length:372 start_codon:yes stop_codon:yes gene_type:complete